MLIKSVSTTRDYTQPKLYTGQTNYQIFSTEKYIFKITPTFETLYRYEIRDGTNSIEQKKYKRIQNRIPWVPPLEKVALGEYMGEKYRLYKLYIKQFKPRIVYKIVKLVKVDWFTTQEEKPMYFMENM